ncbi:hypothetical protein SLA2020_144610 [Shorea laevis]
MSLPPYVMAMADVGTSRLATTASWSLRTYCFGKRRGSYDDKDFATLLKLRDRTVSLKLGEVAVEIRLKKWDVP